MDMIIKGIKFSGKQIMCLLCYYTVLRYLPSSDTPLVGRVSKWLRYKCCKNIFKYCGNNVNIEGGG